MGRERGSVTVWVAGVAMLAMVVAMALVRVATSGAQRGRAQAAADLVALAGVSGGRGAATSVASANGAVVVAFAADGERVDVRIRRDGTEAAASAEWGELPAAEDAPVEWRRGVQSP